MTGSMLLGAAAASAVLCTVLILCLKPLLARYALARPNARSSHRVPTPQGAGIAVLAATLAVVAVAWSFGIVGESGGPLAWLFFAALLLAVTGGIDDIRPLPAAFRLVVQALACGAVVVGALGGPVVPHYLPPSVERLLLIVALVWFVNLVNFMDGIDWITVAEIVPIATLIGFLGWFGVVPPHVGLVAAALVGAMIAFAPFNRPVARLFLGDVGSLPIGLLTGWLLIELAGKAGLVAALLPPLYYIADTGLTLIARLAARQRVWEAHRSHFYQRATDHGFSVIAVDAHVVVLNLALCGLASAAIRWPAVPVQFAAFGLGCGLVAITLMRFAKPRRTSAP